MDGVQTIPCAQVCEHLVRHRAHINIAFTLVPISFQMQICFGMNELIFVFLRGRGGSVSSSNPQDMLGITVRYFTLPLW